MTLALNGTPGHTFDTSGTTTTVSANITTTVADTIVIAVISGFEQTNSGGAVRTVSSVSGGGLTWAQRSANSGISGNIFLGQEVWWAHASGTLTAQSITATFNLAPNQSCDIMVFAVSGSPTPSSPWDSNVGLPVKANHMSAGSATTPTATASTSSTHSMALEFLCYAFNALTDSTKGSSYTSITTSSLTSGMRSVWAEKSLSASGSQTFDFINSQNFWLVTGDALNGDAPSASGTITTTLTKISQSVSGKETFTGTISTSLKKANLSAAGWTTVKGTMTTALSKANLSLSAKETFTGTITTSLSKASFSALTAIQSMSGTITMHLSGVSQAVSGYEKPTGTITTHLSGISQALSGAEKFTGTIATHLQGISQLAHQQVVTGTMTTALRPTSQTVTAKEIFTGTIATNIDMGTAFQIHAQVLEVFTGTITTRLSRANFALIGEEDIKGTITTRLGTPDGHMTANVVNAQVIILGPILMHLGRPRQSLLGAQLGTPGAGKWYSYRYLDS